MKKILSVILTAVMVLSLFTAFSFSSSALEAIDAYALGKPTDFTDQVKWATAYSVYLNKLPIVRADAQFISGADFEFATAPGSGTRTVTFTDWAEQKMTPFFNDDFCLDDGAFYYYGCVWANNTTVGESDDRGRMTAKFTVEEAGTYEFVFFGCADVKEANASNPQKERGFAYDVDGQGLAQVNITKTYGSFANGYNYNYSKADLDAAYEKYKDIGESGYYEPTYYYGITFDLTAGEHVLSFYNMFYSSDGEKSSGSSSRLNFMGVYIEKAVSEAEFNTYKYPETEAETTVEATTAAVTTKAAETSAAPVDTTAEPTVETTAAATPDTTKAVEEKKSGCGSVMGLAAVMAIIPAAVCIRRKKH